jgi:tetratricopeptide (TPR) repeat protein
MAYTDLRGLPVSTRSAEALAAYERGIDLFLRWREGAPEAFHAAVTADPGFALGHCTRAYVAWRTGKPAIAREAHRQAMALADGARDERERLHVRAVDAMERCDAGTAQKCLEEVAERYPTDRIGVRLLSFMCIAQGDYRHGLEIGRRSLAAWPDDVQFQTMAGFFLEQTGHNAEGLAMSRRALASDPTNLFAYHAVGHAHIARGDYPDAVETFERAASLERYGHIIWHLGEAQAILGHTRLTRDYSTASTVPPFERIALMWRLEALGGERVDDAVWKELTAQADRMLEHADYLTTWMHHWFGVAMARAGQHDKAMAQVERLRRLPPGRAAGYWSTLGADLLEGEMAVMRGDDATAARLMAPAVRRIHEMGGGSREQKDIFCDLYLAVQRRLGNADEVIQLAQRRLLANPCHIQSLAALAWAYGQTGQSLLQLQACQRIVDRAAEAGLRTGAQELVEARETLEAAAA